MRFSLVLLAALSALSACGMFGNGTDTPVLYEVRNPPPAAAEM
jgi:hypothetical protein